MPDLDTQLSELLHSREAAGLLRRMRKIDSAPGVLVNIEGRELLNFSSNDYLGLAQHPALKEAAVRAAQEVGCGASAARLICGNHRLHAELEEEIAAWKGTAAALLFTSGFATALGALPALVGKEDCILLDRLAHACLVDGARLSGATLRVFRHNDLEQLSEQLTWSRGKKFRRVWIVTESVFSMDGDCAPLREIVALKELHGAALWVDEAHASGLYGEARSGLCEALGLSARVEVQMGTLGKAVGAAGGYIAGSRTLIDFLVNHARSFVFSTAPTLPATAAALAGIKLIRSAEGASRSARTWQRARECSGALNLLEPTSAILPLLLGAEERALDAAAQLREAGLWVPAIRYPTVQRGKARLRITLSAAHEAEHVARLAQAVRDYKISIASP